jgi:undecaprenyl-diphosphatase
VLIQLGAIMAILTVYFTRLWADRDCAADGPQDTAFRRRHPARLPARRLIGALAHGFIKSVLFETTAVDLHRC